MDKKRINLAEFMKTLTTETDNMTLRIFHFNPIMVNTLVLHDDSREAIIVDPGNITENENEQLQTYLSSHNLQVKCIVNTHPHIDHIAGNPFCSKELNIPIWCHKEGLPIYRKAYAYAMAFGLSVQDMPEPSRLLDEGDCVEFGHQSLQVLYTPGHCAGSISLYNKADGFVICGDLLFEGSVGRSDLPTGNAELLLQMVRQKIFALPDNTVIYPGHGGTTTVGKEKSTNPFLL